MSTVNMQQEVKELRLGVGNYIRESQTEPGVFLESYSGYAFVKGQNESVDWTQRLDKASAYEVARKEGKHSLFDKIFGPVE